MTRRLGWRGVGLVIMTSLCIVPSLAGQDQAPVNRALATREDLEKSLAAAAQGTGQRISDRDRQVLEHRLKEGDFQVGDRLVVTVQGEKALSDTFTVRAEQMLVLPDMPPLSLHGVLRSELQDRLLAHVSQYIRSPDVTAEALLRIGVLGAVVRPGYYNVRAAQPLGDMLTVAGGLSAEADLGKAQILRDGKEYWPRDDVRRAMASGQSLDLLGLKGGDEFMIGRRGGGIGPTVAILGGLATLVTTIVLVSRN
jgi:hypothetical protein